MGIFNRVTILGEDDKSIIQYGINDGIKLTNTFNDFKVFFQKHYFDMLNYKIELKLPKINLDEIINPILSIKLLFEGNKDKFQEKIIIDRTRISNLNPSKYKVVDKQTSFYSKSTISEKTINHFLKSIKDKLIELWNLSNTYDELAFLIFHINEMPPLCEISLESNITMIINKLDVIKRKYPNRIKGINSTIISIHERNLDLSKLEPQTIEELEIIIKETLNYQDLRDYKITDEKYKFSYLIELLGYATTYSIQKEDEKEFNKGRIGLDLKKIKGFNTFLNQDDDYNCLRKYIFNCSGYDIDAKDFVYNLLLEEVFFHEFGHLYFGHCNSTNFDQRELVHNPDEKRESYANFFASLILNSQRRDYSIWLTSRLSLEEYHNPILLNINLELNNIPNCDSKLKCKNESESVKRFKDLVSNEIEYRLNNGGFHGSK